MERLLTWLLLLLLGSVHLLLLSKSGLIGLGLESIEVEVEVERVGKDGPAIIESENEREWK